MPLKENQGCFNVYSLLFFMIPVVLACVASVSVGFSARSRHFSLLAARKSEKCFKPAESLMETLATQATVVLI